MSRRRKGWVTGAPQRVSQDATPANPMMIEQRINRARTVADSDIVTQIARAAERRTGRPRLIPLDAVIAGFVLHASGHPHTMTMAGLRRTLHELTPAQLESLGFPVGVIPKYKRIRSSWRAALRVVSAGTLVDHDHELEIDEDTGELAPCPEDCSHVYLTLEEFLTQLVQASLPPGYERGTAVAIDGTDVESHTRPHRKRLDSRAGPSGQPTTRPDGVTAPPPTAAPPNTSSDTKHTSPRTRRASAPNPSRKSPPASPSDRGSATAPEPA